jgi:two-component system chemotaxis sensor kinase CheA
MRTSDSELRQLLLSAFAGEAGERLRTIRQRLLALEGVSGEARTPLLEAILRDAHSLKGAARAAELTRIELLAHQLESLVGSESLGLAHGVLAALDTLVEETGAELADRGRRTPTLPLATLFETFPRMVETLAAELVKEVRFTTEGGEIELGAELIDQLRSPVTHMVRNCVDHGVESPDARRAARKPRAGTILLRAYRRDRDLVMEVVDDGAGIDVDAVRRKAAERGLIAPGDFTEREPLWLIFRSGLSTKDEVTSVSGRGVGLDVVREHIDRLHGLIDVHSTPGVGTRFTLSIPLGAAPGPVPGWNRGRLGAAA